MPREDGYKFPDEIDQEEDQEGLDLDLDLDEGKQPEGKEEDVEVEIIDDTPEEDRGHEPSDTPIEEPTDEELADHSRNVQKRIRQLTKARHDERRRADQLAREKAELIRYLEASKQQGQQQQQYIEMGQKAYIEVAKQAAQSAVEAAKGELKKAYDDGDNDAIVAAQERLSAAQVKLQEANNYRPTPLQAPQQQVYNPQQADREHTAQPSLDDNTADWLADNPWFQREEDIDMRMYAMGVHAKLERERGAKYVGSSGYYKEIDKAMRKVFPDRFEDAEKKAPAAKKPTSVVAPAQRSSRPKKIRLTQSQANIARELGISLSDYAKQLAALEKDNGN